MQQSDDIGELAAALAKAQGNFTTVAKNKRAKASGVSKRTGQAYNIEYAYADIADVLAAALPVLSAEGLSIIQPTVLRGDGLYLVTRLMHASGQWIESVYPVCSVNGDHQSMGSAITYARRYALCSLIGIAADEDTDGVDSGDMKSGRGNGGVITADQVKELRSLMETAGADEQRFLKYLGVGSLAVLPARQFENARAALKGKRAQALLEPKL